MNNSLNPLQQEENCQGEIHIPIPDNELLAEDYWTDGIFSDDECSELHEAAKNGDWSKVESLHSTKRNSSIRHIICYPLTERSETVLHIAAAEKKIDFVEEMLTYVEPEDLDLKDTDGNNAFCIAAIVGAKVVVKKMLNKNPNLLRIPGGNNMTPLCMAATFGQSDMAEYLHEKYEVSEVIDDVKEIFFASMRSNLYDLSIKLLDRDEQLSVYDFAGHGTALHMLAKNPLAFTSGGKNSNIHETVPKPVLLLKRLWKSIKVLKGDNGQKYMDENKKIIFDAARLGNSQFLKELIDIYPGLVLIVDEKNCTIFHIALLERQVATFNLIDNVGDFHKQLVTALTDDMGNNLLHLAAKYSDISLKNSTVPGAALQMQQELRFFEEVESLVLPSYREMRNSEDLTPREVFTREHNDLLKSGEDWMKKTAESCILVATIVATVAFAAAFTLPGDYDENGIPRHLKNAVFISFIVADAVTVSSASISILLFLSIFTSRFNEEDFQNPLPLKLMFGVLALFISVTCMMVTFSLSYFLAYSKEKSYMIIPILICVFVFGPVILFLCLQRYLLKETVVQVRSLLEK